jgi:ferredoxin
MPHIIFDEQHCAGHALCNATSPAIYQLDDNGYCVKPPTHIDDSLRAAATAGADACPERALTVTDDGTTDSSRGDEAR